MASRHKHYDAAGTYTLQSVERLDRVMVNTGVASATVTVRYSNDDVIAVIAADNPDVGRVFDRVFGGIDLEVVLSGATDVTVLYD